MDGPYSGYNHTIIYMGNVGPAYYSEEGGGHRARRVENLDSDIDWANLLNQDINLVLVIYSTGGTFGKTDGYFDPIYATPELKKTKEWVIKNKKKDGKKIQWVF